MRPPANGKRPRSAFFDSLNCVSSSEGAQYLFPPVHGPVFPGRVLMREERTTKRAQYIDKCFVYADKIFRRRQKNVAKSKKLCYDLTR